MSNRALLMVVIVLLFGVFTILVSQAAPRLIDGEHQQAQAGGEDVTGDTMRRPLYIPAATF